MKKYLVVLRGHNYLLPYDGEPRKMGFVATRLVRAETPEAAETIARGSIVRDPRLVGELLNGSGDPTTLAVETVRKLGLFKGRSSPLARLEFFFEDLPEESSPTEEPQ